jgi:adenylate cyclase
MACTLAQYLHDTEGALEVLEPYFERTSSTTELRHLEVDPDLDPIREDPRFKDMLVGAKKRLGIQAAAA